jgi:hypothetical protein
LDKWAAGTLSAVEVQELALLAEQSGAKDTEVSSLASLGARGGQPQNISGALHRRFCDRMQLPEAVTLQVPAVDMKGDASRSLTQVQFSMMLPHDWVHYLGTFHPAHFQELFVPEMVTAFWEKQSLENPKFFQNELLDTPGWQQKAIPLLLHGDAAAFSSRDSLLSYSMKGLFSASSDAHLLLAAFPKSCTATAKSAFLNGGRWEGWAVLSWGQAAGAMGGDRAMGRGDGERGHPFVWLADTNFFCVWSPAGDGVGTWDLPFKLLRWSFGALLKGVHPSVDADGRPFEESDPRHALQGQLLVPGGFCAVVWGIAGDLDFFGSLGLPYAGANEFCFRCRAGRKAHIWTDFRPTASWRGTLISARELKRNPPSTHEIFKIPGIGAATLMVDCMHVLDLGITLHVVGNTLHSLCYGSGQNPADAFAKLWRRVQELYRELNLEHRCTSLQLRNICNPRSPQAEYPCLSGVSAAEARHLSRAVRRIAEDHDSAIPEDRHRTLVNRHLVQLYDALEGSGLFLDDPDKFKADVDRFLLSYSALATMSMRQGRHVWSAVSLTRSGG